MIKKFFNKSILNKNNSIKEAIENLALSGLQICFVCDGKKLLGTITDGDIRRAILKKVNLETKVEKIMNNNYISITINSSPKKAKTLMNMA